MRWLLMSKYCQCCGKYLEKYWQEKFCSLVCAGQFKVKQTGTVDYFFSADGITAVGILPTGIIFRFDSEKYELISSINWYSNSKGKDTYIYDSNGNTLHRLLMGNPEGYEIDYKNLDTLDNRQSNLRICSHRENKCNQPLQSNNTSGISGVTWKKNRNKWYARIKHYGQEIHLGAYTTFIEAIQARNEGMKWIFGEFGIYNDVPEASVAIKEYVKLQCSCYVDVTTISFEEGIDG